MMYSENDISNSIKNGILYLEDPVNHVRAGPGWVWLGLGGRVVRGLCSQASLPAFPGVVSPLLRSDQ